MLSKCDGDLGFPLELQQVSQVSSLVELGTQVFSRVATGGVRPPLRGVRLPLKLQVGTWPTSRVAVGESGPFSSCSRELGIPLELWWEINLPLELRWGSWAFSHIATVEKGLLSS